MKRILGTAGWLVLAAALTVATLTACSGSDDIIIAEPQQPATPKTCTLTVNAIKGDAMTRALSLDESGAKNVLNATWTQGDKVTVYYMYEKNAMSMSTEIGTLTAQSSGASTTLTGEITTTGIKVGGMFSPTNESHDLAAGDKLVLSYSGTQGEGGKVYSGVQDGTLQTLSNYFDNASADVTVKSVSGLTVAINEDAADFENLSFIIRFTLKDNNGNAISPSELKLKCETSGEYPVVGASTITIPTSTYETNGAGVVFVKLPQTNQTTGFSGILRLTATVGADTYVYEKSGVTFGNGQYYEIAVKMYKRDIDLSALTANFTARSGQVLSGTLGSEGYKISVADGAMVTLSGVTITNIPDDPSHEWAGINCPGDATIVLASGTTNTVKGGYCFYPGIYIAPGKTLTIEGDGTLNASSNGDYHQDGAGIGGGYGIACGNIVIKGGTIIATGGRGAAGIGGGKKNNNGDASWGNITISGGNITAKGGQISTGTSGTIYGGAGIGSGGDSSNYWGHIYITGGTINATGGQNAAGIGGGSNSDCGSITISGGTVDVKGGDNGVAIGTGVRVTSNGAPFCGDITITDGVTRVTATKGTDSSSTIGATNGGTRGKIIIGGVEIEASITDSPYTYKPTH